MQGKSNLLNKLLSVKVIAVLIAMFMVISYLSFSGTYTTINKDAHSTVVQKVYTSQSTKSKSLGTLNKNQNIYVYGQQNSWYQVKIGSKKGWIPTKNVKMGKYVAPPVKVNKDGHSAIDQKVYTSQNTKGKTLGSIKKNQNVYIYASQNGWYQIGYGKTKGWVIAKNVKIGKYVPPAVKVNKDGHMISDQRVYTSQNTKGKSLGTLKKNQNVYVYASQNGWYQVGYGKTKGWVIAKYVKMGKYVAPKPSNPSTGGSVNGWVAPVLKSSWSSNHATNLATLKNELGFRDDGSKYSLPEYPGAMYVIERSPDSPYEVDLTWKFWTSKSLPTSYRIPIVSKELFKLYFGSDANRVWNYFNSNDIPDTFTANGRTVKAGFDATTGTVYLKVGRK
ncbi:hypothetical protein CVD28_04750 [Bacillus sp. M6-12]|uniref:SH3 domain-containing protein n=1 Tax=Bacillus sp. M6-12 TaxID=2054166 RepID=UPI000C766602|nr:SH3 domain-containing protein [Bacillus sp. M6-12]PLS19725.1 hypothetical protein CVD28_04750 [Bacillus sp. M6-12]